MTARIGYLAALTSGPGDPAMLSPPRRQFPATGFPGAEPGFWQAAPGPADVDGPADPLPAGRRETDTPHRAPTAQQDGEPLLGGHEAAGQDTGPSGTGPSETAAEPDGRWLPAVASAAEPAEADSAPIQPHRARPATGRSGSLAGLPGLMPPSEPAAYSGDPGPAARAGEPLAPASAGPAAVDRPAAAVDGPIPASAAAQPSLTPAAPGPGSAPGPWSAGPPAGDPISSPAPGQEPPRRPGTSAGPVPGQAPGPGHAGQEQDYPGAAVPHAFSQLSPGHAILTEPASAEPGRAQRAAKQTGLAAPGPDYPGAAVPHALDELSDQHPAVPGRPAERSAAGAAQDDGGILRPARTVAQPPGEDAQTPHLFPAASGPPDQLTGHAVRPQPGRQAPAAPASASTSRPTLSIGTIEVTVLAPAHDPVLAARRERRQPPDRLSRDLGPHFGQGQT